MHSLRDDVTNPESPSQTNEPIDVPELSVIWQIRRPSPISSGPR